MSSRAPQNVGPEAISEAPPDKTHGAIPDAIIIIFGAAVRPDGRPSFMLRQRVEAAARFGSRFAAPLFIPTGAIGRHGPSEASVMAALLHGLGIADPCIALEETGTDTLSSVRAVRQMVQHRPAGTPVFAATSGFHLPRCVLLLRLAGVPAHPATPPPSRRSSDRWTRWYWWLREAAALPYDAVLMLWLRLMRTL